MSKARDKPEGQWADVVLLSDEEMRESVARLMQPLRPYVTGCTEEDT